MRILVIFIIGLAALGCGKPNELYPLRVGSEWRYTVQNGLGKFLHSVKVTREMPTSIGTGYELQGSLGDSILVWDGPVLRSTVLAGTRFNPPLTLLDGSKKEADLSWNGKAYCAGKTVDASAKIRQEPGEWASDLRRKATKTTMTLQMPGRTLTVVSYYVRGMGLVSQTQHASIDGSPGDFEVSLEHISGP